MANNSDLTPANKEILKQYERKMRMFNAIDQAFTKIQEDFDKDEQPVSFIEMKEAVNMLLWKIETYEDGAKFMYHMSEHKPNVTTTFKKDVGIQ